jgi:phage terminase Nu1 subunit (DNA packaging protein)
MAADLTWSADRMAKFIDVTPRRLAQLVQEGVVERAERGRYNPFVVTVAYIRWLRDQRTGVTSDSDKLSAEAAADRARRQKAEADTAEILAAEKRGALMLTANHRRWVRELGAQTKARIVGVKYISSEAKKKLCNLISEITVTP